MEPHGHGFAKLAALIEALDVGMLTTSEADGTLRSRPMATQRMEGRTLWFFSGKDSPKMHEIGAAAQVNVSYADPNNQIYVSVSGIAKRSGDRHKIGELWNDRVQRWFPQGPADPQLSLLAVEIAQAEYWDVGSRAMVRLLEQGATRQGVIAATDHTKLS
jgi:general stress protein 26